MPRGRVFSLGYEAFVAAPEAAMRALSAALGLEWDRALPDLLPLSPTVVSLPGRDKWRRNADAIEALAPVFAAQDARARAFLAETRMPGT